MICEDFIMLGRTVPEESKKHGITVCSAGYSKEMRELLRIYPLPRHNGIEKWTQCVVPLRRNSSDNRKESWRINCAGDSSNDALGSISVVGKSNRKEEFDFLKSMASDSIKKLNEDRKSLAIVAPSYIKGRLEPVDGVDPYYQMTIWERQGEGRLDINPRVQFHLADGFHDLQFREWGAHELIRKNREDADDLFDVLNFTNPAYEHLLLIGNMNQHRNNWLVISSISRKKEKQEDMFGFGSEL
jgi:hypothetical protein